MNIRSSFNSSVAGALVVVAFASAPAIANITYVGHRTTDQETNRPGCCAPGIADFSITTDGTVGAITAINLVSWQFLLQDRGGTATFNQTNSHVGFFYGARLNATASDLLFDFVGITAGQIIWETNAGRPLSQYCLQCDANFAAREIIYVNDSVGLSYRLYPSVRNVMIASATTLGGVPEPSLWATMILGFGLVGAMLRRRGRQLQRFALRGAVR